MKVDASQIVGTRFPSEAGAALATHLLDQGAEWGSLEIVVTGLPPSLLTSSFFNGFLQTVHELEPSRLDAARSVRWVSRFAFQQSYIACWTQQFKPFEAQLDVGK